MMMKRRACVCAFLLALPSITSGAVLVSQSPVSGGGVSRSSQLWQDPGPGGNDLDSDAVCWQDFTLTHCNSDQSHRVVGNRRQRAWIPNRVLETRSQDNRLSTFGTILLWRGPYHPSRATGLHSDPPTGSAGPGGLTHYVVDLAAP